MKILHVLPTLDPRYGGPVEGARQLAIANLHAGVESEFVSCDDPRSSWLTNVAFRWHALGPSYFNFKFNLRLANWIKANASQYDLIVVNGIWQYQSIATYLGTRGSKVPYVVFPHGMLDPWFNKQNPLKAIKKTIYWKIFEHAVLSNALRVIFTCEEERNLARSSFSPYRIRETVIGYGISEPEIDYDKCRRAFNERFPALNGKKIILFLGRIHPKKGCDLLLNGFRKFLEIVGNKNCKYHLVFAGPNEKAYTEKLKRMQNEYRIQNYVTWIGMLEGELKWGAYLCADVFCLPSHQENFGIAVVEALAVGCPTLISNKINIHHEIARDGAGFVENDSVVGVSNLLQKWNALPFEDQENLRISAKSCFTRNFRISKAAEKLRAILNHNG